MYLYVVGVTADTRNSIQRNSFLQTKREEEEEEEGRGGERREQERQRERDLLLNSQSVPDTQLVPAVEGVRVRVRDTRGSTGRRRIRQEINSHYIIHTQVHYYCIIYYLLIDF